MLSKKPGIFFAGEMLNWDAPTGGYLITAALATGLWSAKGVEKLLLGHTFS
jgi:Predicted flavoproteins